MYLYTNIHTTRVTFQVDVRLRVHLISRYLLFKLSHYQFLNFWNVTKEAIQVGVSETESLSTLNVGNSPSRGLFPLPLEPTVKSEIFMDDCGTS